MAVKDIFSRNAFVKEFAAKEKLVPTNSRILHHNPTERFFSRQTMDFHCGSPLFGK